MVTIHRAQGMRVVIFLDDHEPAQVHVFGDGEAKINLVGRSGARELVWAIGMTRSEVRRDGDRQRAARRDPDALEEAAWLS